MIPEIEMKGLVVRETAGSRCIFIPIQYTEERMTGGVKVGETVDIVIKRHEE